MGLSFSIAIDSLFRIHNMELRYYGLCSAQRC
jgi:hypothetical protein